MSRTTDKSEREAFFEAALRSLQGPPAAGASAWLAERREAAATRFRETGLPSGREELWRQTPLSALSRLDFEAATAAEAPGWARALVPEKEAGVILVDGRLEGTVGDLPAGLTVTALDEALAADPEALGALFDAHRGREQPFASLNTALFDGGLLLRVARGAVVETPLHLVHAAAAHEGSTARHPRVLVLVEAGAQARVVETFAGGEGTYLTNAVTEVVLEDGAILDHVRVQQEGPAAYHLGTLAARQGRDSRYGSHVVSLGGAFSRVDLDLRFEGPGAEARLDGLYLAAGDQLTDHHTVVEHGHPHCTSRQRYRGALDGAARAIFDGRVEVRRDAQKTVAHQENRNLVLSDRALVNTKPSLEIDADDVKCSHGATVGQLDPEALFYLRARGIGEQEARAVLTWAFARALLEDIPVPSIHDRLGAGVLERLPAGEALKELS